MAIFIRVFKVKYNYYDNQFDEKYDQNFTGSTSKVLLIASTPRSGSHMLGHMMIETGLFGIPFEYFNPVNMKRWMELWNVNSTSDYVMEVMRRRTTDNGVFCAKIHFEQLNQLGGITFLNKHFPSAKYVHIYREDKVMQAVSLAKARMSGIWIHGQEPIDVPIYNYKKTLGSLRLIENSCLNWNMLKIKHNLDFTEVSMEKVLENPTVILERLCKLMGLVSDKSIQVDAPVTQRQQNSDNIAWAKRFCEDYQEKIKLKNTFMRVLKKCVRF